MPKGKMKILIGILIVIVIIIVLFFFTTNVTAFDFAKESGVSETAGTAGYTALETGSVQGIVGSVIIAALSIMGIIFLALMLYGGFLWMTDRGNADSVEKAKKLIAAAVTGIIIVMGAYAISYFVISSLSSPSLEAPAAEEPAPAP